MKFIESTHTYVNSTGEYYRSVTSLLKSLEPKKDWKKIAQAYATKHGLTLEEVQAKWDHEKNISIERGKKYHATKESETLNSQFSAVTSFNEREFILPVVESAIINGEKESNILKLSDGVYPELMLWLDSAKIAGQADKVEIVDGYINIIDYKTNKKIDKESWKDRFGKSEKLLSPCSHLDNCNFNIYSLQLNMYAYIIKRHNPKLKIGNMVIKHIQFDEDGNAIGTTDIQVPDLQKEVKKILSK